MAETYDTTIIIGGRIRRADLDKLWRALESEVVYDIGGAWVDPVNRHNYKIEGGETLGFGHSEQPWGNFGTLEPVLIELGLPFERYSDDGDRRIYTGAGQPEDTPASPQGDAVIDSAHAKALGSYEAILAYFARADFSPPPFEIVGDDDPRPVVDSAALAQAVDLEATPPAVTSDEIIACLAGALQAVEHQVEQMAGMFGDEDGTIKEALEAGEHAWAALDAYRNGQPMPDPGGDDDEEEISDAD